MFDLFNKKSAPKQAAGKPVDLRKKETLLHHVSAVAVWPDGTLVAQHGIDLSNRGIQALPDLSGVTVLGDFNCSGNKLTSLKGAPKKVYGKFDCSNNDLTSLEHGPEMVEGDYISHGNKLPEPDPLSLPPAALREELAQFLRDAAAQEAVTLGKPLAVSRPLSLVSRRMPDA